MCSKHSDFAEGEASGVYAFKQNKNVQTIKLINYDKLLQFMPHEKA